MGASGAGVAKPRLFSLITGGQAKACPTYLSTINVTGDVCVIPPPVAVTVMVYEPGVVFEATVMVMVELPEPGTPMDMGLKDTVTPVGWPAADKAIAESKPPEAVVLMVVVPLDPCTTKTAVGDAEIAKAGAVTVSVTVEVWVMPPPVPVTVIVYDPGAAFEATVTVMVELPEPGAPMGAGLKATVTPDG